MEKKIEWFGPTTGLYQCGDRFFSAMSGLYTINYNNELTPGDVERLKKHPCDLVVTDILFQDANCVRPYDQVESLIDAGIPVIICTDVCAKPTKNNFTDINGECRYIGKLEPYYLGFAIDRELRRAFDAEKGIILSGRPYDINAGIDESDIRIQESLNERFPGYSIISVYNREDARRIIHDYEGKVKLVIADGFLSYWGESLGEYASTVDSSICVAKLKNIDPCLEGILGDLNSANSIINRMFDNLWQSTDKYSDVSNGVRTALEQLRQSEQKLKGLVPFQKPKPDSHCAVVKVPGKLLMTLHVPFVESLRSETVDELIERKAFVISRYLAQNQTA